jgi:hypothetical protein
MTQRTCCLSEWQSLGWIGGLCLSVAGLGAGTPALSQSGVVRHPLTTEHVDLKVVISPEGTNLLQVVLRDHLRFTNRISSQTVILIPEAAQLTIPPGFETLGPVDSQLWVLPASQDPRLLFLGLNTEGLKLSPQVLDLFVRRIEGPAHFCVWQFDGTGGLALTVQSRDGLTERDRLELPVGAHQHHNLGFSAPGLTTVWFQARAQLDGTNAWSAETPILFSVEPLPESLPILGSPRLGGPGNLDFFLSGTPGKTTYLETSPDLLHWDAVGTVTPGFDPVTVTVPVGSSSPNRFYRAR